LRRKEDIDAELEKVVRGRERGLRMGWGRWEWIWGWVWGRGSEEVGLGFSGDLSKWTALALRMKRGAGRRSDSRE